MSGNGRPLRFLAVTLAGWTGARIAFLWYVTGQPPASLPALLPVVGGAVVAAPHGGPQSLRDSADVRSQPQGPRFRRIVSIVDRPVVVQAGLTAPPLTGPFRSEPTQRREEPLPHIVSPAMDAPVARADPAKRSRWSGDAWLLLRGGTMRGAAFGAGQLGGSQAGVRIAYALARSRRVALVGRLDTALRGKGREAAFGVEWHPAHLPVRLVAEERLSLDGGKVAPAVGAIAGLDPTPIAVGFRLEAYGQAGALDRDGVQGFAEGAARATRAIAKFGPFVADLGAGAWGGAQRGAARLDIGPTLGVAFRLGELPARLTIDWRQRIAGRARPGSGLAMSLGTDF